MDEETVKEILDPKKLLLRNVHPDYCHDDEIGSVAFTPTSRDSGRLSVDQEELTTPERSFEVYTKGGVRKSSGVWGVSISDIHESNLKAFPDPIDEIGCSNPAHAFIDFRRITDSDMTKNQKRKAIRKVAIALAANAFSRGCLHKSP